MTPEPFCLNGVFEMEGKYGPIQASGVQLRNIWWKDIIEGSGSDGHGDSEQEVHNELAGCMGPNNL